MLHQVHLAVTSSGQVSPLLRNFSLKNKGHRSLLHSFTPANLLDFMSLHTLCKK